MTATTSRVPDLRGIARTSVSPLTACQVLSARLIRAGVGEGQFLFSFASPIVFFVGLYVPMYRRFEHFDGGYAQYLAPVIILQAGLMAAILTAEISAGELGNGVRDRLASLPMERYLPVVSRMIYAVVRTVVALCGALVIGFAFGFRFHGTTAQTLQFVAITLAFSLALSMLTDSLATVLRHPDAIAQILLVPQLIFVMLSTGLVPIEGFPDWIAPMVRNQPVSILADSLRALSSGADVHYVPVIAWLAGLLGAGVLAVVISSRTEVRR